MATVFSVSILSTSRYEDSYRPSCSWLTDSQIDPGLVEDLLQLPLLEPAGEFWVRAGRLRAVVLARKRKARLGDALIAQLCLDQGVQLVTRDRDFRAFAEAAGLAVVAG